MFQWQAVLKGRSPDLVGYLIAFFVTILVLLLIVTVITDGRVRKFVVMLSSVSLLVSFLKELISVTAVLKNISLSLRSWLLSFLSNTVAYQSVLVAASRKFVFQS